MNLDRNDLKAYLLTQFPFCDVCGHKLGHGPHMHESIVPKRAAMGWPKGKRGLINHRYNCHLLCCERCHQWAHAHPRRMVAIQIARYGYDEVQKWIDSLEFKVPYAWHRGLDEAEAGRLAEIRRTP